MGFPGGSVVKNPPAKAEDPWTGRSPGGGNGNPSSILAWRIPWTEEPGWRATVLGVAESDTTEHIYVHFRILWFWHTDSSAVACGV